MLNRTTNEDRLHGNALAPLAVFAFFAGCLLIPEAANAFLYKTPRGTLKDNYVLWHSGKYYLFTMYKEEQAHDDRFWRHVWLATSTDGVHWADVGPVIKDAPFGIYAMRAWKAGDRFVLNHGSFTGDKQDVLRLWESKDLLHWKYLGEEYDVRRPDGGRLDHMDVIPITTDGKTTYYGYAVGGTLRSDDGVKWTWTGDYRFTDSLRVRVVQEPGGCERIGGKYYLLVGGFYPGSYGYSVGTFIAEDPMGPFRPDYPVFRLTGNSGRNPVAFWAGYCRLPNELLITNYILDPGGLFWWHAPLKKAVVDGDGHLRLGYWSGNDLLRGAAVPVDVKQYRQVCPAPTRQASAVGNRIEINADPRRAIRWLTPDTPNTVVGLLDTALDSSKGFILEGGMKVLPGPDVLILPAIGLLLEEKPQEGTAILFQTWEQTEIGRLHWSEHAQFDSRERIGFGCATVTGIPTGRNCSFRLLFRRNIFELYLDDLLVQTYSTETATGRIGFVVQDGEGVFENLRVWEMNL